ncbi:hypothetical protein TNCV_2083461 [Trichonephila clavipes]|nr:hypothetical protein TNCV_2083461 [Trichonephila clavipes]
MDVCKCTVPLWHWGTLNSHRAASPLVRLMEGEERWEAFDHHRISLEFFLDFLESKVVQRKNEDELYRLRLQPQTECFNSKFNTLG